jgi:hypothetical protein
MAKANISILAFFGGAIFTIATAAVIFITANSTPAKNILASGLEKARWEARCEGAAPDAKEGIPIVEVVKGGPEMLIRCAVVSENLWQGEIFFEGDSMKGFSVSVSPSHIYLNSQEKKNILIRVQAGQNFQPVSTIYRIAGSDGNFYKIKFLLREGEKPSLPEINFK